MLCETYTVLFKDRFALIQKAPSYHSINVLLRSPRLINHGGQGEHVNHSVHTMLGGPEMKTIQLIPKAAKKVLPCKARAVMQMSTDWKKKDFGVQCQ